MDGVMSNISGQVYGDQSTAYQNHLEYVTISTSQLINYFTT